MKTILGALMALLVLSFAFIGASAEDTQRVFFKVKGEKGKSLLKNIRQELPGNVVSLEASTGDIEKLKENRDLEFMGTDHVREVLDHKQNHVMPRRVGIDVRNSEGGLTRLCRPQDAVQPQIGYGIKYMYENLGLTSTSGGRGVKVAVLDTGANRSHLDIMNRIVYCKDMLTNTYTCDDTSSISTGHGTGVASVIAADGGFDRKGMYGMAPQAQLYIIKVCTGSSCYDGHIAAGIYDAVNRGAKIISMSFGGPQPMSSALKDAIDYAYENNVLLVAGVGNSGPGYNTIYYPAAYHKVVAVGAIREDKSTWPNSARGINDGDYVMEERDIEFGAPGVLIPAASKKGCYKLGMGTSYATPHVSGLAAKIWDGNALSTRAKLQSSAMLHDLDVPGDDNATGFGMPTVSIPDRQLVGVA